MKISKLFFMVILVSFTMISCKPIYKCGEAKPQKKLFLPKNVLAVIDERDSLCTTLSDRNSEISTLKSDISVQKNAIGKLEKQYSDLMNQNLSQSEQYNLALKQKSDELRQKSEELMNKEVLLFDRERALGDLQNIVSRQDSIAKRLNDILRNALLSFKSDELSVEQRNGKVYVSMSDKLLFKSGSAAVETKGKEAIKVLAEVLSKNSDVDVSVEGHTDNLPIKTALYNDNWDLSVARSISIVRILTGDYKIQPTRLTASGKGEFSPRATNATPEGRASNRRTEIVLSPKLEEIMKLINAN